MTSISHSFIANFSTSIPEGLTPELRRRALSFSDNFQKDLEAFPKDSDQQVSTLVNPRELISFLEVAVLFLTAMSIRGLLPDEITPTLRFVPEEDFPFFIDLDGFGQEGVFRILKNTEGDEPPFTVKVKSQIDSEEFNRFLITFYETLVSVNVERKEQV